MVVQCCAFNFCAIGDEDDDVPDMEDCEDDVEDEDDAAALPAPAAPVDDDDHVMATRTYDVSISYDKFYQVIQGVASDWPQLTVYLV